MTNTLFTTAKRFWTGVVAGTFLFASIPCALGQNESSATPPSKSKFGIPYPPSALAVCASGITILSFVVGLDGLTKDVKVTESSGNDVLDQASVIGMGKTHWQPATLNGKPVEATKNWRVTWNPDFGGKKCVPASPAPAENKS